MLKATDQLGNVQVRVIRLREADYHCVNCSKYFCSVRKLEQHRNRDHGIPFSCRTCHKGFNTATDRNLHTAVHLAQKPFQCKVCGTKFTFIQGLIRHQRAKTCKGKRFNCGQCSMDFPNQIRLNGHLKTIHALNPHKCPWLQCDRSFPFESRMLEHFRTHTGEKPYKCEQCVQDFTSSNGLQSHRKFHHLPECPAVMYTCNLCVKSYTSRHGLKYHMKSNHRVAGDPIFACDQCNKKFPTSGQLRSHKLVHSDAKLFVCGMCGKRLRSRWGLRGHAALHAPSRTKYKCEHCGKEISTASNLKKHKQSHAGEKSFACAICGKTFRQKSGLNTHVSTHTKEKPYECEFCHRRFRTDATYVCHLRLHTGERPFPCQLCGKRFNTSSNLGVHMKSHSEDKPFECPTCGVKFKHKYNLAKHQKKAKGRCYKGRFPCNRCGQEFLNSSQLQNTGENVLR